MLKLKPASVTQLGGPAWRTRAHDVQLLGVTLQQAWGACTRMWMGVAATQGWVSSAGGSQLFLIYIYVCVCGLLIMQHVFVSLLPIHLRLMQHAIWRNIYMGS
jgi:hypothetical protein